jgi:hypothetical protein
MSAHLAADTITPQAVVVGLWAEVRTRPQPTGEFPAELR